MKKSTDELGNAGSERLERRDLLAVLGAAAGASILTACVAEAGESAASGPGGGSVQGSSTQALAYVDPSTPNGFILKVNNLNAAGFPVTLVVNAPLQVGNNVNLLVKSHITLRFEDSGQLVVSSNAIVQVFGPIEAVPDPSRPLFAVAAGAGVIPRHGGTLYYANWWDNGDGTTNEDIGKQWNNMVSGIAPSLRKIGAPQGPNARARYFGIAGSKYASTCLDLSGFGNVVFDFSRGTIIAKMTSGPVLNFTDTDGARVLNLHVLTFVPAGEGDPPGNPEVGVLLARPAPNPTPITAGRMTFVNAHVAGSFQFAALYNVASESNVFVGGWFENGNPDGKYAVYLTILKTDSFSAGSLVGTPPVEGTAGHSADNQTFFGTTIIGKASSAAYGSLYLNGFTNIVGSGMYLKASHSPYLVLDAGVEACTGITLRDAHCQAESTQVIGGIPEHAVLLSGENGHAHIDLSFRHVASTGTVLRISAGASPIAVTYARFWLIYPRTGASPALDAYKVDCSPQASLYDCEIHMRAELDATHPEPKVVLGANFTGTIHMGDLGGNRLQLPTGRMEGRVFGSVSGKFTCSLYGELSIAAGSLRANGGLAVKWVDNEPAVQDGEAVLWMWKGGGTQPVADATAGDVFITTKAGAIVRTRLVNL
jgi:hypothetical protein